MFILPRKALLGTHTCSLKDAKSPRLVIKALLSIVWNTQVSGPFLFQEVKHWWVKKKEKHRRSVADVPCLWHMMHYAYQTWCTIQSEWKQDRSSASLTPQASAFERKLWSWNKEWAREKARGARERKNKGRWESQGNTKEPWWVGTERDEKKIFLQQKPTNRQGKGLCLFPTE